jgi:chromosome partitioning protein
MWLRGHVHMKTIAIISQKGGAGKTTAAVHLATAASLAGHRAAIIDLDPQGTAASWGDRREAEAPEVVSGQAARLGVLIEAAQGNGADLLILDTAPNADQTALRAAQLADLVLIPCRAATFDLEAIQATLTLAELARKPSYVVLNAIPPRSGIGREAAEGLTAQGARVAPAMLSQRAAFAHGVIDGRTAQEFEPGGKAAEEIETLYTWLCGTVGMSTGGQARKAA